MLQGHADARPRGRAAAPRVDEHIRRLEVRRCFVVARLPALEPGERIPPALRAGDLDQRMRRHAAPRRLYARRLAGVFLEVRRPRRVAETLALMTLRELKQRGKRPGR